MLIFTKNGDDSEEIRLCCSTKSLSLSLPWKAFYLETPWLHPTPPFPWNSGLSSYFSLQMLLDNFKFLGSFSQKKKNTF